MSDLYETITDNRRVLNDMKNVQPKEDTRAECFMVVLAIAIILFAVLNLRFHWLP
jgi:hypothetical protein